MSILTSSSACLQLARPANCGIAFASVLVGAFVAGGDIAARAVFLAGLSEACLCAGANATNDRVDVASDRRNKPARPLVTGRISRRGAACLAGLSTAFGLCVGAALGPSFLGVAACTAAGAAAYNLYLKQRTAAGTAVVSGTASLAFLYGGLTGPSPAWALIPAGFACLLHFGREILKDVEDAAGDALGRTPTLPLAYGTPAALTVATAAFVALIPVTLLPALIGWFGMRYLAVVLVVDALLLYVIRSMWRDASPRNAGRLSGLLKAGMVIGLIAVCLGR